jgi:hypothetical protein
MLELHPAFVRDEVGKRLQDFSSDWHLDAIPGTEAHASRAHPSTFTLKIHASHAAGHVADAKCV